MDEQTPSAVSVKKVNRQLYENSGLQELFADCVANGDIATPTPDIPFFNQKTPNLAVLHEKPEHRLLLLLKMRGFSNREIAQESGYSEPWLSQLFRQPWAQATMAKLATDAGVDELQSILKSAAADSLYTLIELRDDANAPAAVRRSAADSLLDRFLGKPKQSVEVSSTQKVANVDEVEKELELLSKEENRLLGKGT